MSLRTRIVVVCATIVGLIVGPATVIIDRQARSHGHAARDAQLAYASLDLVAAARVEKGKLNIERYVNQQPRPGAPLTAFIDGKGTQLDGDVTLDSAFAKQILARAKTGTIDPGVIGDKALVAEAIAGAADPDKIIAVAVAYIDDAELTDRLRTDTLQRIAIAIGAWLGLSLMLSIAMLRLLGRPHEAVAVERSFFADAAHELKTPWAIVRARAEHAEREGAGGRDIEAIAATAVRAGRMIDDMLALARLDIGKGAMTERVSLRIDALVETCAEETQSRIADAVRITVNGGSGAVVMGDESLLRHAVSNLLDNAIVHGGGGGVVDVTIIERDGTVRVSVADRGPGVAPSQHDRIFERFHRAAATSSGGSGLGLSIGSQIAAAHGGRLEYADREDGPGARFTLILPS